MTRRHELELHLHGLREIREILNSMKSLAYMETRKLSHQLDNQQQALQAIKDAAVDFLSFYPYTLPETTERTPVYVIVGTERGFCGDFNEQVKARLEKELRREAFENPARLIVVGNRLYGQFPQDPRVAANVQGADTAEEIEIVLARITDTLEKLHLGFRPFSLTVVFCDRDSSGGATESLLPPFQEFIAQTPQFSFPPLLNLEPTEVLLELAKNYLIAALNEILQTSLLVENQRRLQHLEGAVQYLDKRVEGLRRRSNQLRQEEIIEEIEVILMGASRLERAPVPGTRTRSF